MEIEIHRMKMRLEGLQREQEAMIKEMERGIAKREASRCDIRGKRGLLPWSTQTVVAGAEEAAGRSRRRRGSLAALDAITNKNRSWIRQQMSWRPTARSVGNGRK